MLFLKLFNTLVCNVEMLETAYGFKWSYIPNVK